MKYELIIKREGNENAEFGDVDDIPTVGEYGQLEISQNDGLVWVCEGSAWDSFEIKKES